MAFECPRVGKLGMIAEEVQTAGLVGSGQLLQKQSAEQAREHAHRQEEAWPAGDPLFAIGRDAATGHDTMQVRVMGHRRSPGMQHGAHTDAGADTLKYTAINELGDQIAAFSSSADSLEFSRAVFNGAGAAVAVAQITSGDAVVEADITFTA